MRMKFYKLIPWFAFVLALSGCSTVERVGIDGAGGLGAGAIGYVASKGNPVVTAASAVGGTLLTDVAQNMAKDGEVKKDKEYYDKGCSDTVKKEYWILVAARKPDGSVTNQSTVTLIPYTRPAQTVDGVNIKETTDYIRVEETK